MMRETTARKLRVAPPASDAPVTPVKRDEEAPASALARFFLQEDLNFLVTNRIPRRYATLLAGWYAGIQSPTLTRLSLAVFKLFADDLRLEEAKVRKFRSLRDVFVRELKEGARPIDPDPAIVVSPCDAVVGAHGSVDGVEVFQAKGFPYTLPELLGDATLADRYRNGRFVTLRLKSNMYHRFHAPADARVRHISYISGDTWNVNPIALARVERLFCRNERAVVDLELATPGLALTMVPVAAILVASMRFRFLQEPLNLRYRGPNRIACDVEVRKGDEIGWFESGSTIVLLASGFELCDHITEGSTIRMGQPLLRRPGLYPVPTPTQGDDR